MLKRIRRLHVPLAIKCQILFGAAVVIVIAAALAVVWQRMDQLSSQIDEAAAHGLVEKVLADHVAYQRAGASVDPNIFPFPNLAATQPVQASTQQSARLIGFNASAGKFKLSSFDKSAANAFRNDPDRRFDSRYVSRKEGADVFRYAEPALLRESCIECHKPAEATLAEATSMPSATQPTTRAARAEMIGIVSVDIPTQIVASQALLNRVFIFTAGLLAGALAIVVLYMIITRLILAPVQVLQKTAEKVSAGDLNIRSDISTGDEFQLLSDTFNRMLSNLQAGEKQLREINKGLDSKLNQLEASNVALYESNRLKSEFLANVSHELRTPLNSILGFAELLKEAGAAKEPKTARYIQNITQSGRSLLELINDLLDLAKIEAGRMEVRCEPLSLRDVFEGLVSVLKPLTEPKKLGIEIEVADNVPILRTDPTKLQQILYNFLSNAIKFSPAGDSIELSANLSLETNQRVRISVSDHGPGIDPSKQNMIFEKFRQLDGSVTREHGGTGLGLSISRELTILLGGQIGLHSAANEGATFWIELPIQNQPVPEEVQSG